MKLNIGVLALIGVGEVLKENIDHLEKSIINNDANVFKKALENIKRWFKLIKDGEA